MKFKPLRVEMVKEIGEATLDLFIKTYENYCVKTYGNSNNGNKFDVSLLRTLCNVIENGYIKKHNVDEKLDKKNVVLTTYKKLKHNITYSAADDKELEKIIEDLHNTGQIQRVPLWKIWKRRIVSILKKAV